WSARPSALARSSCSLPTSRPWSGSLWECGWPQAPSWQSCATPSWRESSTPAQTIGRSAALMPSPGSRRTCRTEIHHHRKDHLMTTTDSSADSVGATGIDRAACENRDANDPLRAFREEFLLPPETIYLDG